VNLFTSNGKYLTDQTLCSLFNLQ